MLRNRKFLYSSGTALLSLTAGSTALAADEVWTNAATGFAWNNANNWLPSTAFPNGAAAVADFNDPSAAGSILLNGPQTVGQINFASSSTYKIVPGSGGSLTFDDTGDPSGVNPKIDISLGVHAIAAPVALNNGLKIALHNSAVFVMSNPITGPGIFDVDGSGLFGIAATNSILDASAGFSLTNGSRVLLTSTSTPSNPAVQVVATLSIDTSSVLDIENNELIVSSATIGAINHQIFLGYNGGGWNGPSGIVSGTAQADPPLGPYHGIGYKDLGGGAVEMRFTLLGDVNLDGTVNFADLLILAQNYNTGGINWTKGDFNYDGTVNFTDLLALARNYNVSLTPGESQELSPAFAADYNLALSEVAVVPEPASLALITLGAASLLARRRPSAT